MEKTVETNDLLYSSGIENWTFNDDTLASNNEQLEVNNNLAKVDEAAANIVNNTTLPKATTQVTAKDVEGIEDAIQSARYTQQPSLLSTIKTFVSDDAAKDMAAKTGREIKNIMANLEAKGIPSKYENGRLYITDDNGISHDIDIDPGFKFITSELTGSIAGALAALSVPVRVMGPVGATAGFAMGLAASALAAGAGRAADTYMAGQDATVKLSNGEEIKFANAVEKAELFNKFTEGATDDALGAIAFSIMGVGVRKALNTQAGQLVKDAAVNTAKGVLKTTTGVTGPLLSKDNLKKTGISSLVGAGIGVATGDFLTGTLGSIGTRVALGTGKKQAKQTTDATGASLLQQGKEAIQDLANIHASGDKKYLETFFDQASPSEIKQVGSILEAITTKAGANVNKPAITALARLMQHQSASNLWSVLTTIENGFPAKNLNNFVTSLDGIMQKHTANLVKTTDIQDFLSNISIARKDIQTLNQEVASTLDKLGNITLSIDTTEGGNRFVQNIGDTIRSLNNNIFSSTNIPSDATVQAKKAAYSNSSNTIIKFLSNYTPSKNNINNIQVNLKDLVQIRQEMELLSSTGKLNRASNEQKTIYKTSINKLDTQIKALLDKNVAVGNITEQESSQLSNMFQKLYLHSSNLDTLTNSYIVKELNKGIDKKQTQKLLYDAAQSISAAGEVTDFVKFLSAIPKQDADIVEKILIQEALDRSLITTKGQSLIDMQALSNTIKNLGLKSEEAKAYQALVEMYEPILRNSQDIYSNTLKTRGASRGQGAGGGVGMTSNMMSKVRIFLANRTFGKILKWAWNSPANRDLRITQFYARALANPLDAGIVKHFDDSVAALLEKHKNDVDFNDIASITTTLRNDLSKMQSAIEKGTIPSFEKEEIETALSNASKYTTKSKQAIANEVAGGLDTPVAQEATQQASRAIGIENGVVKVSDAKALNEPLSIYNGKLYTKDTSQLIQAMEQQPQQQQVEFSSLQQLSKFFIDTDLRPPTGIEFANATSNIAKAAASVEDTTKRKDTLINAAAITHKILSEQGIFLNPLILAKEAIRTYNKDANTAITTTALVSSLEKAMSRVSGEDMSEKLVTLQSELNAAIVGGAEKVVASRAEAKKVAKEAKKVAKKETNKEPKKANKAKKEANVETIEESKSGISSILDANISNSINKTIAKNTNETKSSIVSSNNDQLKATLKKALDAPNVNNDQLKAALKKEIGASSAEKEKETGVNSIINAGLKTKEVKSAKTKTNQAKAPKKELATTDAVKSVLNKYHLQDLPNGVKEQVIEKLEHGIKEYEKQADKANDFVTSIPLLPSQLPGRAEIKFGTSKLGAKEHKSALLDKQPTQVYQDLGSKLYEKNDVERILYLEKEYARIANIPPSKRSSDDFLLQDAILKYIVVHFEDYPKVNIRIKAADLQ